MWVCVCLCVVLPPEKEELQRESSLRPPPPAHTSHAYDQEKVGKPPPTSTLFAFSPPEFYSLGLLRAKCHCRAHSQMFQVNMKGGGGRGGAAAAVGDKPSA